ncbi:Ig-like domain-containing protein [Agrococcus sp. ARC_14]|uniref:Ig-like domain-containing protein n=1 Tax=Agrococcus sp. ARC_14 TaxID=2919927 RepID=UPI001F067554|nr:Ig-like domain-containing protein [Agrococcus sp. ARC_14]MCH1882025.1 cadherin-like domain-containing protein [Agrococcus sp. ARC_14]
MTFRAARGIPAGITALAVAAALSVATAVPANAAESTAAADDSVTVDANHSITVDVLANDTAPEGTVVDLLTASGTPVDQIVDLYGTWSTDGTTITHTPPDGRAGPRTVSYRITDADGDTATAQVRMQVSSINAPYALQDFATVRLDQPLEADVLANDLRGSSRTTGAYFELLPETLRILDAAGAPQTSVENAAGSYSVADGRISYQPTTGYWGSASIRYVVQDEVRQSTRATSLNITVSATPDAVDDAAATEPGAAVTVDVLANDLTPEGTTFDTWGFTVTPGIRVGTVDQPGVGVWTRDAEQRAVFTPAEGFTGTATVDYMLINSRSSSDVASISVIVEEVAVAPTLTADEVETPYFTDVAVDVLANDSAPEGTELDAASLRLVDGSGELVTELTTQRGTWSVVDGELAFAPEEGAYGTDSVTYSVATIDGAAATSAASVLVRTPRVLSAGEIIEHTFTAEQPTVLVDVLANDRTEGNSSLDPSTLAISDHNGSPVQERVTDDGTWSVVDGQVQFAPAEGFEGQTSVYYIVENDAGFTGRAVVAVNATWAAAAPTLTADEVDVEYFTDTTVDVLANDSAPEGTELDAASLALVDEAGALVSELTTAKGTWSVVDGQLAFSPAEGAYFADEVTYSVATTEGGTATTTVTATIDYPNVGVRGEIVEHTFSADEPSVLVDVLANDTTEGNTVIDVSTLAIVDHNGSPVQERVLEEGTWSIADGQVQFAPAEGFEGRATVYYWVENSAGAVGRATVTVDVTWETVEASVDAQDDEVSIPRKGEVTVDVLANDSAVGGELDPSTLRIVGDGGELVESLTTRAGTWTVVDGEIHFDAHSRQKGDTSIEYVVGNGAATDTATLTVDVDQHQSGSGPIKQLVGAIIGWLFGWLF